MPNCPFRPLGQALAWSCVSLDSSGVWGHSARCINVISKNSLSTQKTVTKGLFIFDIDTPCTFICSRRKKPGIIGKTALPGCWCEKLSWPRSRSNAFHHTLEIQRPFGRENRKDFSHRKINGKSYDICFCFACSISLYRIVCKVYQCCFPNFFLQHFLHC